jgi:hypothetical protein
MQGKIMSPAPKVKKAGGFKTPPSEPFEKVEKPISPSPQEKTEPVTDLNITSMLVYQKPFESESDSGSESGGCSSCGWMPSHVFELKIARRKDKRKRKLDTFKALNAKLADGSKRGLRLAISMPGDKVYYQEDNKVKRSAPAELIVGGRWSKPKTTCHTTVSAIAFGKSEKLGCRFEGVCTKHVHLTQPQLERARAGKFNICSKFSVIRAPSVPARVNSISMENEQFALGQGAVDLNAFADEDLLCGSHKAHHFIVMASELCFGHDGVVSLGSDVMESSFDDIALCYGDFDFNVRMAMQCY